MAINNNAFTLNKTLLINFGLKTLMSVVQFLLWELLLDAYKSL